MKRMLLIIGAISFVANSGLFAVSKRIDNLSVTKITYSSPDKEKDHLITITNKTGKDVYASVYIQQKEDSVPERVGYVYLIRNDDSYKVQRPEERNLSNRYLVFLPIPDRLEFEDDKTLELFWANNLTDYMNTSNQLFSNKIDIKSKDRWKKTMSFTINKQDLKYQPK
jgi:hypothetical protein